MGPREGKGKEKGKGRKGRREGRGGEEGREGKGMGGMEGKGEGMGRDGKGWERGGPQFKKNYPPPVIRWLVTAWGVVENPRFAVGIASLSVIVPEI